MNDEEPSINIPSLLMLAVVSFFVVRWFMNRGNSDANATGRARGGRRMIDPAHVEQISQMFPQLNRRDIMWDLQRNGGSMAATTERILTGRGLDTPPPSYQPQIPQPATPVPSATPAPTTKSGSQDLISRYNLTQRISEDQQEIPLKQETGWSQNKTERQRLLQKRRDDMILAARRKLQQKDRETSHATGPAF